MKRSLLLAAFIPFAYNAFADLAVAIQEYAPAICTYPSGSLAANADGGTPPYTYIWNTGETTTTIQNVAAGLYSVTVIDDAGAQATAEYTVTARNPEGYVGAFQYCPSGGPDPFRMLGSGGLSQVGNLPITFQNGTYHGDVISSGQPFENALEIYSENGWPTTSGEILDLPFTDASGCPGVIHATITPPFAYPVPQVLAVYGACSDGSNGGVLVHVPVAQHTWPNYIDLVHNGVPFGRLADQVSAEQSFGYVPLTVQRNDLPAGVYAMVVTTRYPSPYAWLEDQFTNTNCGDTTWFTVPDLGYSCGTLTGTVFMDDNFNCSLQYMEARLPSTVMQIEPGGFYAMTNASGVFQQNLPYGSYTVQQQPSTAVVEYCAGVPQAFDLNAGIVNATVNFPDSALLPRDVTIGLGSTPARPGFQMSYGIQVDNLTAGGTGAITITLVFDPVLSFVNSIPAPTSVVANTITWDLSQITSFSSRSVVASFQVPPDVALIGTDLVSTASVVIAQSEPNTTNNFTTGTRTITGAYDPNAKEVRTSSGLSSELYYIDQDTWLDYTIQFQNTGNDTAFFVVVTDTLAETLDPATFKLGARSHACMVEMADHGVLRFIFPNILLPDSTSNEPASHGFVCFRIQPRQPLVAGTRIENIANIYFDYNPPVITEPSVLTAEFSTGVQVQEAKPNLLLMPNPTSGSLEVRVSESNAAAGLLQIVAVDGRVVLQQRMEGPRTVLDVTRLSRGLYTLNWQDAKGTVITQRFVKE